MSSDKDTTNNIRNNGGLNSSGDSAASVSPPPPPPTSQTSNGGGVAKLTRNFQPPQSQTTHSSNGSQSTAKQMAAAILAKQQQQQGSNVGPQRNRPIQSVLVKHRSPSRSQPPPQDSGLSSAHSSTVGVPSDADTCSSASPTNNNGANGEYRNSKPDVAPKPGFVKQRQNEAVVSRFSLFLFFCTSCQKQFLNFI